MLKTDFKSNGGHQMQLATYGFSPPKTILHSNKKLQNLYHIRKQEFKNYTEKKAKKYNSELRKYH